MTFTGIDHIDITVQDPAEMARFYESLGFTILRHNDHGGLSVELRFPGEGDQPILELTSASSPGRADRPLGLRHIAMRCADIHKAHHDLTQAGFITTTPPKLVHDTGRTLFNVVDPQGGPLQVVDAPS